MSVPHRSSLFVTLLLKCLLVGCGETASTEEVEAVPTVAAAHMGVPADDPARPTESDTTRGHALLVGCTQYPHLIGADLRGGDNDVAMMAELLTERFDFEEGDIVTLCESSGSRNVKQRPTRANIVREFENLADRAGKGDRVVVLLSGHGAQQPDDEADDDAADPEPDGLDEVFCPADTKPSDDPEATSIPNGIRDDEIGAWLDAIRLRGADVWVVVDACHSGTSTRGHTVQRRVPNETLLPNVDFAAVGPSTRSVARESSHFGGDADEELGSLVAIYAAQPHEPTIEIPVPLNDFDASWHGLLTYTIVAVLRNADNSLSYRELVGRVHATYVGAYGMPGPTPLVEGTVLDREVLGRADLSERSPWILGPHPSDPEVLSVSAGRIDGLVEGAILAVHPPAGQGESEWFGHVRVVTALTRTSVVEPCEFDGVPAPPDLPLGGVCRLARVEYGDLRLSVAVQPEFATSEDGADWTARLEELTGAENAFVRTPEDPATADWFVSADEVGRIRLTKRLTEGNALRVFGQPQEVDGQEWLESRLRRIARVENLLRIARENADRPKATGLLARLTGRGPIPTKLKVELKRLVDTEDRDGEKVEWDGEGIVLRDGELVGLEVHNPNRFPVDLTVLFVDGDLGIIPLFPQPGVVIDNRVEPGQSHWLGPMRVDGTTVGIENLVIVAVRPEGPPVDFTWLGQESIERVRAARSGGGDSVDGPLGELLQNALFATGSTRGIATNDANQYAFRVVTWRTAPASGT